MDSGSAIDLGRRAPRTGSGDGPALDRSRSRDTGTPTRDARPTRDSRDVYSPRGSGRTYGDVYAPRRDSGRSRDVVDPRPERNRAQAIFTRSGEGRRYDNGVSVRGWYHVSDRHIGRYFHDGYAFYPYYSPVWISADVYYGPFSFYYGVCPPYVYRDHCFCSPPRVVYVEIPVYAGDECRGYREVDDYYLNDRLYGADYDEVRRAAGDIEDAFRNSDIDLLARLTDPSVRIAVYRKGKYDYSLDPGDYLDMTRDALRVIDTVDFDLTRIRRRSDRVYVASGKHVYRDSDGSRHTVYVSFALERVHGDWAITQVATSPDRVRDF